jgi:hypothetical protein
MTVTPERSTDDADSDAILATFRTSIAKEENLLYGVALFFEGISVLYAGEEAMIETYRKQLRNLIQSRRESLQHALSMLEQVEQDSTQIAQLSEFSFPPWQADAGTGNLADSAKILVDTYDREFPDRPRAKPFEHAETLKLMKAAALSA